MDSLVVEDGRTHEAQEFVSLSKPHDTAEREIKVALARSASSHVAQQLGADEAIDGRNGPTPISLVGELMQVLDSRPELISIRALTDSKVAVRLMLGKYALW
jgi:hypothetical protein